MAMTAHEARVRIRDDLAAAIDQLALAMACLSEAFEQLDVGTADALEAELFTPVRKALGRGKRTLSRFVDGHGLPAADVETHSPGRSSQSVQGFVERAVLAAAEADRIIAELQDSMLPIESGDAALRTGLSEVRELLDELPGAARQFLRTLGR
jgi:hypothetical protein